MNFSQVGRYIPPVGGICTFIVVSCWVSWGVVPLR